MKGYNGFIVKLDSHIIDNVQLSDNKKLYKDPSWQLGENAPMTGKIVSEPKNNTSKAKAGDLLFFEHIITMQNTFGVKSNFCIDEKEKLYYVPYKNSNDTLAIAFKRNNDWQLIGKYNLLKAIKIEREVKTISSIILINYNTEYEGYKEYMGIAHYLLPELEDKVYIGDTLLISKHSEYKVDLEGTPYYAVATADINAILK